MARAHFSTVAQAMIAHRSTTGDEQAVTARCWAGGGEEAANVPRDRQITARAPLSPSCRRCACTSTLRPASAATHPSPGAQPPRH
eukprot:2593113-Heterocapsa_arctica.AAC.1